MGKYDNGTQKKMRLLLIYGGCFQIALLINSWAPAEDKRIHFTLTNENNALNQACRGF